jgi:hypothetical protein
MPSTCTAIEKRERAVKRAAPVGGEMHMAANIARVIV